MQVRDGLVVAASANIRIDGVALDGARTDQRDFNHQVVETPRLHSRQRRHLRARLDLEHADGVGFTQQVVDGVFLFERTQIERDAVIRRDLVDRAVQGVEHAQSEQVELHQPDGRTVVLVPLQHRAPGHAPPLHRTDLEHRPVTEHHAS